METQFKYNDGGRAAAGFKGKAGDCVIRAIAIATGLPYRQVYTDLFAANAEFSVGRSRAAKRVKARGATPRNGNFSNVFRPYLEAMGWKWTPTMRIGQGCKVHLRADELPPGRLVVKVTRHVVAVIDGVINDTYDPSRRGTRCVYGYWSQP